MTTIDTLREARSSSLAEAQRIIDAASAENRDLHDNEKTLVDRLIESADQMGERLEDLADDERRAANSHRAFRRAGLDEDRMRTSDAESFGEFLRGRSGSTYAVPFTGKQLRAAGPYSIETRDWLKGTNNVGGYSVPLGGVGPVVEALVATTPLLMAANVMTTAQGAPIVIPTVTAHTSAAITAEAGSISESDPTFAGTTLGAYKFAAFTQASRELLEDSGVDIEALVGRDLGTAIGAAISPYLATGTGSSQPQGIVAGSTLGKTAAGAAAITADELIDLHASVAAPYRASRSCGWVMNDATAHYIQKLKTSGGGDYVWRPGLESGQPPTLLGHPVYIDPGVDTIATGKKTVIFGDLSRYQIRIVKGVEIDRSVDYAFQNDLVSFRAVLRIDAKVTDTTAIKHLVQA